MTLVPQFSTYCALLSDLLFETKKSIFHLWGRFIIRKHSTNKGYIVTAVLQRHLLCFLGHDLNKCSAKEMIQHERLQQEPELFKAQEIESNLTSFFPTKI